MSNRKWFQYNRNLVQRGSLSFYCHRSVIRELKKAQSRSRSGPGRPPYSLQLILILMLLKISYSLTYRSCEGMARSLFSDHGIRVPAYSTLCRGVRHLCSHLPRLSNRRPRQFLIDASGFKIAGEGEWKVKIHGNSYHRSWLKVHVLVDSNTNEIVDLVVSPSSESDITGGLLLLETISGKSAEVFADGAYDGDRFRKQAFDRGVKAVIPPPVNGILKQKRHLVERNDAIKLIALLGGDEEARRLWGKLVGYNNRVKVESAFSRLKRLFGSYVFSRDPEAQFVEMWLKAWLSNYWLNLNGI